MEEKRLQGDENRKEEKDKQSYDCVIDALRIARLYYSKSIPGDVDPCRSFRGGDQWTGAGRTPTLQPAYFLRTRLLPYYGYGELKRDIRGLNQGYDIDGLSNAPT